MHKIEEVTILCDKIITTVLLKILSTNHAFGQLDIWGPLSQSDCSLQNEAFLEFEQVVGRWMRSANASVDKMSAITANQRNLQVVI